MISWAALLDEAVTKPGSLLKHHIPVKTDRWEVQKPGFTEIDLVSHSGNSAAGDYCYSLNVTDIDTGWTETRAVLGKGQQRVQAALEAVRQTLPFPLRGINSDNGSEFINAHLWGYCHAHDIQFTRGRPYKKDDNAHIQQKKWTHVRRLLGYVRYDTENGAGGYGRALPGRTALVSEPVLTLSEAGRQGADRLAAATTLRSAADPFSASRGLCQRRSRSGWQNFAGCNRALIPLNSRRPCKASGSGSFN